MTPDITVVTELSFLAGIAVGGLLTRYLSPKALNPTNNDVATARKLGYADGFKDGYTQVEECEQKAYDEGYDRGWADAEGDDEDAENADPEEVPLFTTESETK